MHRTGTLPFDVEMSRATDAIQEFVDNYGARSPEVASRWDWAVRSSEQLDIVVSRYRETAAELAEATKAWPATTEAEWHRTMRIAEVLEVDVISFFVFASMLLDMVARGVAAFGGQAQGVRINSHHD